MFWLHAIYRGEQGPPIGNVAHWLLDSTLGCIALTPMLVVLLPAVDAWTRERRAGKASTLARAGLLGAVFAMVTGPGPVLHDIVAGRGTPLARLATKVFGEDPHVAAPGSTPSSTRRLPRCCCSSQWDFRSTSRWRP